MTKQSMGFTEEEFKRLVSGRHSGGLDSWSWERVRPSGLSTGGEVFASPGQPLPVLELGAF